MNVKQLSLLTILEEKEQVDMPYRNADGELLPWEEPEYLKELKYKENFNQKEKIYD